jgi:hypothetical protein
MGRTGRGHIYGQFGFRDGHLVDGVAVTTISETAGGRRPTQRTRRDRGSC